MDKNHPLCPGSLCYAYLRNIEVFKRRTLVMVAYFYIVVFAIYCYCLLEAEEQHLRISPKVVLGLYGIALWCGIVIIHYLLHGSIQLTKSIIGWYALAVMLIQLISLLSILKILPSFNKDFKVGMYITYIFGLMIYLEIS